MFDWPGWLALVLAVLPAALRLFRTRSLLRHIEDPALPERLARRNLTAVAFGVVLSLEIMVWPRYALGTVPLLIVLFALAGWPLRRALFSETWSFPSYLWFYVRLVVAIYGYWIVLMWSAFLTDLNGTPAWVVAVVLGVVLLVWYEYYGRILRVILRTKPIATPSLVDRFNAIIAKTAVTPPHVEYVDMQGGTLVNALAVPDSKRAAVLFTSSLLERFDDDEVEAIFAHEVAHLEFYNPAHLKRWRVAGWLMVLIAVFIRPLIRSVAPYAEGTIVMWPMVVMLFMAVRGHKQKHETESDLRSAALTGNPEVMVRALIKLYELMKMPRRLDPAVEANASHPSLARRIQAIRAASGAPVAALAEPITFRTAASSVTLHADRLIWSEGEVTTFTLAYASLDELRIVPDVKGQLRLVASDPAGRKWTMPLAGEDVARAQAALNVVDAGLRPSLTVGTKWVLLGRLMAVLCAIIALSATQIAALFVAALAAIAYERPLVRAAGVAILAGGLLILRDGPVRAWGWMLIPFALVLLFLAYRDKREEVSPRTWRLIALIGCVALLLLIPISVAGGDLLGMHQAARTWPGAIVLALAFAAASLSRPEAKWKTVALAAVIVAGASVAIGSTNTLDAILDDPFLADVEPVASESLAGHAAAEVKIAFYPGDVRLSPSGLAVAVTADEEDRNGTIHVGKPGQALKAFRGSTALFVDDRRVLIVDSSPGRTGLQLVDVDALTVTWEKTLDVASGSLSIDRAATIWQVLGFGGRDRLVRITGPIAGGEIVRDEWRVTDTDSDSTEFPLWASGATLIVRSTSYHRFGLSWQPLGQWATWLDPWRSETRLLSIDGASTREILHSTLEVNCLPGSFVDQQPICSGYDGSRTHLASFNPDSGTLTPIAKFPGGTVSLDFGRAWLTGWVRARPFAWHVPSARMIRLDAGRRGEYAGYFASGDDALAVIDADVDATTIRIYRGVAATAAIR